MADFGCAEVSSHEPRNKRPRLELQIPDDLTIQKDEEYKSTSFGSDLEKNRAFELVSSSTTDGDTFSGGDSGFQDLDQSPLDHSGLLTPSSTIPEEENEERSTIVCNPSTSLLPYDHQLSLPGSKSHETINEVAQDVPCTNRADIDDDEDANDGASDVSELSCLSGISGEDWKPISGPIAWVQEQISKGTCSPREILEELLPSATISSDVDNMTLWRLIVNMLSQPPKRKRLPDFNTLNDVVSLIASSKKIIVLTGAGVSVSCGIPDFRSRDGIYARLSKEFPTLPDPQSMFDIHYFRRDPRPFFKFAKEIYPGQFEPSISHKFIKQLESHGKLLRNYTQNIDTLEKTAHIERVITCHGSFATASCTRCKHQVDATVIEDDIFKQRIPVCGICGPDTPEMAIMKPDIVFFGEGLSDEFHTAMTHDKDECDLLLVMGSSLKVRPVALIPSSVDCKVPQVLINREPLNHMNFDVELLGDCDVIVEEICKRLGESWTSICKTTKTLKEITDIPPLIRPDASSVPSISSSGSESDISSSMSRSAKHSIADELPENSFLFIPPARYIFPGAEVHGSNGNSDDSDLSDDDDDDSSDGPCSRNSEKHNPSEVSISSNRSTSNTFCSNNNISKWPTEATVSIISEDAREEDFNLQL